MASSLYVTADHEVQRAPSGLSVTDGLLLAMSLIWGLNFIVVKYATTVFAPLAFNSARIFVALVVLWTIVFVKRSALPSRKAFAGMIALGMIGNGFYQILWVEGMARTRASDAALLTAASPILIEIIGWVRGIERTRPRGIAGILLSLAGIGLVVSGKAPIANQTSSFNGNALVLGSCVCWAVYTVMLKPYAEKMDGLTISAVTMTGGMIPMLIAGAPSLVATHWSAVSPAAWSAVAYSGLVALVVAYLFWYRGIKHLGPTRTAMYANLQPIVAMFAAWAILDERPHAIQLAGGACIIGGLLLTRYSGHDSTVAVE